MPLPLHRYRHAAPPPRRAPRAAPLAPAPRAPSGVPARVFPRARCLCPRAPETRARAAVCLGAASHALAIYSALAISPAPKVYNIRRHEHRDRIYHWQALASGTLVILSTVVMATQSMLLLVGEDQFQRTHVIPDLWLDFGVAGAVRAVRVAPARMRMRCIGKRAHVRRDVRARGMHSCVQRLRGRLCCTCCAVHLLIHPASADICRPVTWTCARTLLVHVHAHAHGHGYHVHAYSGGMDGPADQASPTLDGRSTEVPPALPPSLSLSPYRRVLLARVLSAHATLALLVAKEA